MLNLTCKSGWKFQFVGLAANRICSHNVVAQKPFEEDS